MSCRAVLSTSSSGSATAMVPVKTSCRSSSGTARTRQVPTPSVLPTVNGVPSRSSSRSTRRRSGVSSMPREARVIVREERSPGVSRM